MHNMVYQSYKGIAEEDYLDYKSGALWYQVQREECLKTVIRRVAVAKEIWELESLTTLNKYPNLCRPLLLDSEPTLRLSRRAF
jgi:hypothetical protein